MLQATGATELLDMFTGYARARAKVLPLFHHLKGLNWVPVFRQFFVEKMGDIFDI